MLNSLKDKIIVYKYGNKSYVFLKDLHFENIMETYDKK